MILSIVLVFAWWGWCYFWRNNINTFIDTFAPRWVTSCGFCRGFWLGVIEGLLIAVSVLLVLKRYDLLILDF